jgi:hypothetical protein
MLRVEENPPVQSPVVEDLASAPGQWWVAHTRSRCEKALAWDLLKRGIVYFLPMVERVRMSGGRKRRFLLPLFPSYLFFCGNSDTRYIAMTTNRLHQTLEVADESKLLRELSSIKQALDGKAELDLYHLPPVGSRCRVTAGPFMGLEGIVVARNSKSRMVLEVSMLGQGAALEIDNDLLEPVNTFEIDQPIDAPKFIVPPAPVYAPGYASLM